MSEPRRGLCRTCYGRAAEQRVVGYTEDLDEIYGYANEECESCGRSGTMVLTDAQAAEEDRRQQEDDDMRNNFDLSCDR